MRLFTIAAIALCLPSSFAEEPAKPELPSEKSEKKSETKPDGKFTYVYDVDGRITQKTDPTGAQWRYAYSESGQLLREDFPDGSAILYDYADLESKVPSKVKRLRPDGTEVREAI